MIGNDVIDLALAKTQSNPKRKGFVDKLFTEQEQLMISKSMNPDLMIWNLWSRKEAAYKIYNRQTGIRAFIPKQLECADIEITENVIIGTISIDDYRYFTHTFIDDDFIHTIAVVNVEDFKRVMPVEREHISKDIVGIPFHSTTGNPISISHHGRFEQTIVLDMDVES